jgi:hypothetical protein
MLNPAKVFIILGVIFLLIGIVLLVINKVPGWGRMPGDIVIQKGNFSFYFPLGTSLFLSLVLTLVLYLCARK